MVARGGCSRKGFEMLGIKLSEKSLAKCDRRPVQENRSRHFGISNAIRFILVFKVFISSFARSLLFNLHVQYRLICFPNEKFEAREIGELGRNL